MSLDPQNTLIRRIYDNISELYQRSPEESRKILNNNLLPNKGGLNNLLSRYNISLEKCAKNAIDGEYLTHVEKYTVLLLFAFRGDLLSAKLVDFIKDNPHQTEILHGTDIPQKLLTRAIRTEEEYRAYLNGVKPVSVFCNIAGNRAEYCLPQEEIKKDFPTALKN
jgi:hypothetical protein